ncbi:MAG: ABC transporter substrate-binding protein [Firmicutes bacterium]|nr:ABC transporter substrate-binding protein [Bacillota bacterium]
MKRRLSLVAFNLVLCLVLGTCGFVNASVGASLDPIKIGAVFSLTGEKAAVGYYDKIGIDLAIEEINAAGGINGRPVEVIYEDSRGETAGAVSALKLLLSRHQIAGLLSSQYSTLCFAIDPLVKEAQLPTIVGGSNYKLTHSGNPWMFRNRPNDGLMATTMAKFAVESLGAQRIGVLHNSDEFGTGGAEIATAYLDKIGKKSVAVLKYNSGDKDLTGQLLALKNKGIDTLLWWGHATEAGLVARQAKQLGLKANIIGSNSWVQQDSLNLAKESANGTYAVIDCVPLENRMNEPRVAELVTKFKAKTGGVLSQYGVAAYDSAYLLVEAIRRAGSTDREAIRKALHTIKNYEGILTTYSFDEHGDGAHSGVVVRVVNGATGQQEVVKVVWEDGYEPK